MAAAAAAQGSKSGGAAKENKRPRIKRSELKVLGLLGCGGFGAVELVENTQTKDTFALKSLSKGHVVKCRMQKSVIQEKTIQHMCDSQFIVKLYECYNEPQELCFLLELALGGELYDTYCKKGFHGSVKHAHFYSAATLFAFEHLHEKKIVYRDLKPENLLLTDTGYCKLTDMGLAKIVVGKTNTTCGTPDYFAPEVIAGSGHSHAVDWWTLGILIFELIAGHPPFETANPAQTMKKIQNGIEKVSFPSKLKGTGQDLICGLLKKAPNDRLPMKKGWTDNVKQHQWFGKFDWNGMVTGTVEPPYKPTVKSKKDLKNFSANPADKPPQLPYKDDGSGWDKDFAT
jgi:serine/threonine protein kinase